MYLLGPSGSLFHPLKLPESTSLTKGCFWIFGQFSICNGDNELPTSIYRLFFPFLSFFWPPLSFFLVWKPCNVVLEFLIRCYDTLYFWFLVNFSICNSDNELPASIYRPFWPPFVKFWTLLSFFLNWKSFSMVHEFSMDCYDKCYFGYWEIFWRFGSFFKGSFGKKSFFQLVTFKLGFHLYFMHLVVFITMS